MCVCALIYPVLCDRPQISHITIWPQHDPPQQLSAVSPYTLSILLICDQLSVGWRVVFKFSLPMPLSGGVAHSSKTKKALMQTRVTAGAVSNGLCHGTCIFTSSLKSRASSRLIPAFLAEEIHVPYRSSQQLFELIYLYCWQMCAFIMTYFVHMFTLVLLNSVCLPVYSELFEGRCSVTCSWG